MNDPSRFAAFSWWLAACVIFYMAITLAVVTLAITHSSSLTAQIAQALPGAMLWPALMDVRGNIGSGQFQVPTPIPTLLVLIAGVGLSLQRARGIAAQIREDARVARNEVIRERERQKMRRKD